MDEKLPKDTISPYHSLSREAWAALREDQPMTLKKDEISKLQSLNDFLSMDEVAEIYLPLSRLLSYYVEAAQKLCKKTSKFLETSNSKTPYIIGVAGSVAVGKSTTSRVLQALLARWPNTPKVSLITTDGFLWPNATLTKEGLMERKGFPESYDITTLLTFLSDVKAGHLNVEAPLYSHIIYDVLHNKKRVVRQPDILIVEGLNVLQTKRAKDDFERPFVSDFFDFSIYIDAEEALLERWYVERFLRLRETAFRDPASYFHRYARLDDAQAKKVATQIWRSINLVNLKENIRPTRPRADLILTKDADHKMSSVALRKI